MEYCYKSVGDIIEVVAYFVVGEIELLTVQIHSQEGVDKNEDDYQEKNVDELADRS